MKKPRLFWLIAAICALALNGIAADSVWNVTDYGAKGDRQTDNTAAFQKALDEAGASGGGEVFVPAGEYIIADHIVVPSGVTLKGIWQSPHHADQVWGSALLATGHKGKEDGPALIQLAPSSAVEGLTIYYPEQRLQDVQPYPWAIQGRGMHGTVTNITLVNAYQGIQFSAHHELHTIRNVFGCCLRRGIHIDRCTDIGRIENVHFNPHYWARAKLPEAERVGSFRGLIDYLNAHAEVFIFARTDWEYVLNTFAFGYDKCYKFIKSEDGACNGNFLGIGADGGRYSLWVEDTQAPGLLITNGEFVTFAMDDPTQIMIADTFKGVVQLSNCAFWGPTDRCALIKGNGFTSFSQCNFVQWGFKGKGAHAIHVEGGQVNITSSRFGEAKPAIFLGENTSAAVITGNHFKGPKQITNNAKGTVQEGMNVEVQ